MSLVFECLESAGIDITEPLPMFEGGNMDMLADFMLGEGREAKKKRY